MKNTNQKAELQSQIWRIANDTREVIDIVELNKEIATTVSKIDKLRADIDVIATEIEG